MTLFLIWLIVTFLAFWFVVFWFYRNDVKTIIDIDPDMVMMTLILSAMWPMFAIGGISFIFLAGPPFLIIKIYQKWKKGKTQ